MWDDEESIMFQHPGSELVK